MLFCITFLFQKKRDKNQKNPKHFLYNQRYSGNIPFPKKKSFQFFLNKNIYFKQNNQNDFTMKSFRFFKTKKEDSEKYYAFEGF